MERWSIWLREIFGLGPADEFAHFMNRQLFLDRRGVWAFGLGCLAVTAGVLLHIPMFWMGHNNGFVLAGMPMDGSMIFGRAQNGLSPA